MIGIEIRPEDMEQNNEYLNPLYPQEMMMVKDSFPHKVIGLDSYGEQARGGLISVEMFRGSTHELGKIVQIQNRMGRDTVLQDQFKDAGLDSLQKEQLRMA